MVFYSMTFDLVNSLWLLVIVVVVVAWMIHLVISDMKFWSEVSLTHGHGIPLPNGRGLCIIHSCLFSYCASQVQMHLAIMIAIPCLQVWHHTAQLEARLFGGILRTALMGSLYWFFLSVKNIQLLYYPICSIIERRLSIDDLHFVEESR